MKKRAVAYLQAYVDGGPRAVLLPVDVEVDAPCSVSLELLRKHMQ